MSLKKYNCKNIRRLFCVNIDLTCRCYNKYNTLRWICTNLLCKEFRQCFQIVIGTDNIRMIIAQGVTDNC